MEKWIENLYTKILTYFKDNVQTTGTLAAEAHSAQLFLNLAAPGLILAIQDAGASDASGETQKAVTEISGDLNTVSSLLSGIAEGQPVGAEIVSTLNSLKTNLAGVLTLAHITNSAQVTTITNTTNAVITEIETILPLFVPTATTAPVAATK